MSNDEMEMDVAKTKWAQTGAPERKSRSEIKRLRTQGVERTHYADDETLAHIRKLERYREIIGMAWKGYGYDQEWDCDCPVCAAIRTRTPHDTDGGL